MTDKEKVDAYIKKHERWQSQFAALRKVMHTSGLIETVKWGAPSYALDDKIVVGMAGFKNHCALWFQQGVFLKDSGKHLENAQQGTTRGMRQWRFEDGDKVDSRLVKAYVKEAIENQQAGKRIKPAKKSLLIPDELAKAMQKNARLMKGFESLTPGKQREYADHIAAAKQEKTRAARLEKAIPMIIAGAGLFDKYKNC